MKVVHVAPLRATQSGYSVVGDWVATDEESVETYFQSLFIDRQSPMWAGHVIGKGMDHDYFVVRTKGNIHTAVRMAEKPKRITAASRRKATGWLPGMETA